MNWMKALASTLQILQVAPVLLHASLSIADGLETSIEGTGKGAEKKELAMGAMGLALDTASNVSGYILPKNSMLSMFGGMLDLAVNTYNLIGKFTK